MQIFYKLLAIVLKQYQIINCNNSYSVTTLVTVIHSNSKSQRPYVSGSNTGVSEPSFLNFFARDVWRALSVLSITMKR